MRLLHSRQVDTDRYAARVARVAWWGRLYEGFFALAVGGLLWGGAGWAVWAWWTERLPAGGGLLAAVIAPLFAVCGLLMMPILSASLRGSNWLARWEPPHWTIKFRADANARLPEPHPVVVQLHQDEISWARRVCERVNRNAPGGETTTLNVDVLEFSLALAPAALADLAAAIDAELGFRPGPGYALHHHYPVRLEGSVLRLEWPALVRPRVAECLGWSRASVPVEPALDLSVDLGDPPSAAVPADDRILELALRGDRIGAIALARRHYGMSLGDAVGFVDDLTASPTRATPDTRPRPPRARSR